MKNKIILKKYLAITIIICSILIILFQLITAHQYHIYTNNFNTKIDMIVAKVRKEYPGVSDNDIMNIINSNEGVYNSILEEYNINLDKESVLKENEKNFNKSIIINSGFIIIAFFIIISIFLLYDKRKDKELNKITKYIQEINKKNYTLKIDEISEDELSILKNEIYKTTIMLKENAENSLNDKQELKKSLEDISHQLKTPLTSILVILDNLIDDPHMEREVREDFIRNIKREVTNINFLVQSLLKLSKFDANTIHFIKEKRLLKDIIDEAVKNVSTLCDLKNISIDINGQANSRINCDFVWEVEAITNIIKNCAEHSSKNNKIIIEHNQNNVYASICIQDFAGGISKVDLPHIFDRFYKGKNASQDSVGIGLALARTIIESDNGVINVETNNIGTKFIIKYFYL